MASKAELARQVEELRTEVARLAALQVENDRLTRVTGNALRVSFRSNAALNELFDTLIFVGPTDDDYGVLFTNDQVNVILFPFSEHVTVIDPNGRVPRLVIKAENFVLDEDQQVQILGTVERIKRAADSGSDTVTATKSLTGVVTA